MWYFNSVNSSSPRTQYVFPFICVIFSVFSINVLQFPKYRTLASLGRFIPRYFIHFDAVVNRIIFLAVSDSSLLTYRNTIGFYILILYPAIFLNSLMSSGSFLVVFLGFSIYSIISSANSDSFTYIFTIYFLA